MGVWKESRTHFFACDVCDYQTAVEERKNASWEGNVNRSGECIYHQQGGRWYAKINMDLGKGKRWFCSVQEAEAAGCRPPMNSR